MILLAIVWSWLNDKSQNKARMSLNAALTCPMTGSGAILIVLRGLPLLILADPGSP